MVRILRVKIAVVSSAWKRLVKLVVTFIMVNAGAVPCSGSVEIIRIRISLQVLVIWCKCALVPASLICASTFKSMVLHLFVD